MTLKQIQKELQEVKQRDLNIIKSIKKEINLNTKTTKLKNKYNRKMKHKGKKCEF